MSKKNFSTYVLFFYFILLHIILINNFPLNFEYVFSNFSNFFYNKDPKYISEFFEDQANTLAFAFVSGYISSFFLYKLDALYIARLISLSSCLLIYLGLKNFILYFKVKFNNIFLIILFLNPFIWVFSYRGTPDLFSAAIGFYALSNVLKYYDNTKIYILNSLLVSLAIIFKPHSFIFLIVIFVKLILDKNAFKDFMATFYKNFLMIVTFVIYYCFNYYKFGFFIYSENYKSSFHANYEFFLNNFLIYTGYLVLAALPISVNYFCQYKNIFNLKIIFSSIFCFCLGFFFLEIHGEMDLGIFSLSANIMTGFYLLFLVLGYFSFISNIETIKYSKLNILILLFSILIYLFILSFSKPAQRYLIFPVLLLYVFYFISINPKYYKKIYYITLITLVPVNYFLSVNSYLNSEITKKILKSLETKEILSRTDLGIINSHANFKVKQFLDKKEYKVEKFEHNSIDVYISEFFYIKKIYYLNKI